MIVVNLINRLALFAVVSSFTLVVSGAFLSAANLEAPYTIVSQDQSFEIRDYPTHFVAEISMPGPRDEVLTAATTLLLAYIGGNNLNNQKVATSKPVFHTLEPPLTSAIPKAKTTRYAFDKLWTVSFLLKDIKSIDDAPKPGDRRIDIREISPRRVAVLRFSGFWSDSNLDSRRDELANILKTKGLNPIGDPIYAFYDEFWQPFFWRHNEVMWEISTE
jgi:hypothetical protein